MKKVVIHAERRVFDGVFKLSEAEVSFERFDGTMSRPVTRLCFERGDSVAALLYNTDSERVLLVEQFKYPTYEHGPGWIMETVSGIVESGETPESALRREVLEEVGYEIATLEPIATFYVSPGGSSERVFLHYAEVTEAGKVGDGGGVGAEGEDIRTVELTLEELGRLLATGSIQDAKTLVGLQWLQRRLDPAERP
jgi:nudix-type nucleoside diphosphatase (YffH/AdpP family)